MTLGVLDLFCGAGGASQGIKHTEGFEVVAAVDNDPVAVKTYDDNFSLTPWEKDLTKIENTDILDHFSLSKDDVDVIVGCPPCQPFSTLSDTDDRPDNEDTDLLLRVFLNIIEQAMPPMVLFENVPRFMTKDDGHYREVFEDRIQDLGYGFTLDRVYSADYGVPQTRHRAIGICVRGAEDDDVKLPEPTHAPPNEAKKLGKEPYVTVRDAIGNEGLAELERGDKSPEDDAHRARFHQNSTMEIIEAIPKDGGSRTDLPQELELDCHKKVGTDAGNVYGRMAWDEPGPTLTTRCTTPSCGRFLHPEQDRAITFREAALLMTFPPDFDLPRQNSAAEQVIGNAVPPTLIQNLIQVFKNHDPRSSDTPILKSD